MVSVCNSQSQSLYLYIRSLNTSFIPKPLGYKSLLNTFKSKMRTAVAQTKVEEARFGLRLDLKGQ